MNRTSFLVDGFNLYHSVVDASADIGLAGRGTKWLDIWGLCRGFLPAIGGNAQVISVHYFSALAEHLAAVKPDVVIRHLNWIECLRATNVTVELARFKQKWLRCTHCGKDMRRYEEKETDVAMAVKLFELFWLDHCDTCVLVTGDTDMVPAVRTAKRLFANKTVGFLFPYKRHNKELDKLAAFSFRMKRETYARHQLPDPFTTSGGRKLQKPSSW